MRRLHLSLLALTLASAVAPPARAQADTIAGRPLFTAGDAVLVGGILLGARLIHPLDERYRRRLQDSSTQANRRLQALSKLVTTTVAPGAYVVGGTLYAVGRLAGKPEVADVGLHGLEALVVGEIVASTMKIVVGRARPYLGTGPNDYALGRGLGRKDYKSFPSGHSTAAFAAAAAVTSEVVRHAPEHRWLIGSVMYGGAAMAGVSRMYNNQHWASDIIVGAGIGTLAGLKVVRYQHSNPGNRLDRWLLAGSLVPSGDGGQHLRWMLLPAALAMPGAR
ncbi:MAG: phosphoesterase PA-phosphatase related protein [Gemmatimonadetes bacterium]|jgi:membrane-associated phospholipid phosphatase|nr:phosphoesterase PA-phosphatase related protein [Gemmatimonadota bacterium]